MEKLILLGGALLTTAVLAGYARYQNRKIEELEQKIVYLGDSDEKIDEIQDEEVDDVEEESESV
jgi:Tfp pilus assembly protein PilN